MQTLALPVHAGALYSAEVLSAMTFIACLSLADVNKHVLVTAALNLLISRCF